MANIAGSEARGTKYRVRDASRQLPSDRLSDFDAHGGAEGESTDAGLREAIDAVTTIPGLPLYYNSFFSFLLLLLHK